jgi:hypothetical protein
VLGLHSRSAVIQSHSRPLGDCAYIQASKTKDMPTTPTMADATCCQRIFAYFPALPLFMVGHTTCLQVVLTRGTDQMPVSTKFEMRTDPGGYKQCGVCDHHPSVMPSCDMCVTSMTSCRMCV